MKHLINRFGKSFALLGLLFLAQAAIAPRAEAAGPCCSVIGISPVDGVVTAKENATGKTFQFKVADAALLKSLKVGQGVYANFKTREVSFDGRTAGGQITSLGKPGGPGNPPGQMPPGGVPQSGPIGPGNPPGQMPQGGAPSSAPVGPGKPGVGPMQKLRVTQIDPCTIASADMLKTLLQTGLQNYFPYSVNHEGEHIKISDPTIEQVNCPHMRIEMKAHVQYRETRGFPQYETGGTVKIESPLVAKVKYQGSSSGNEAVTASNFLGAAAVLTNPNITSLQIDKVPGWLTPSWIRDCLNGQYSNWGCHDILHQMSFDVTNLVKLYLEQGNTIAASGPAPNTKPSGFPFPGSSQPGPSTQTPASDIPQGELAPQGEIGPDSGFGGGLYGGGQYGGDGLYGAPANQEPKAPVDLNELTGKIPGTNPAGNEFGGSEGYSIQGDRPWYEKMNPPQGNFNPNNNFNNNPNNFNSGDYNNFNSGTGGGFQQDTSMPPN